MTRCAIVIVDTGPLKTLAYAGKLDLLLKPGIPVFLSDMVIQELNDSRQHRGNDLALAFISIHMGKGINEIVTGVPAIADDLRRLKVDPGDESIRRAIVQYHAVGTNADSVDEEFALLVSEDVLMMMTADKRGNTYLMTTRPFLMEARKRGWITEDVEDLMHKAEAAALESGEEAGRGQLTRKVEFNDPPRSNSTLKPF